MDKTELSIIIVDYKSQKFTVALVADLKKKLARIKHEIIIVDNDPGSDTDVVIARSLSKHSNVKIIKAKENKGFGSGNNLGAKEATGEYLWLLNPDTEIFENTAEELLDFMAKHSEAGAVTPLILQADKKTPQRHFFGKFQSLSRIILRDSAGSLPKNPADFFYADMITAAGLMISRKNYEKVNGFDENIFMYLEDEDFCRRLSEIGLKNAVLTTAKIIHFEGQSSTTFEKKKFYYQSQDYYWQKHYGFFRTMLMKIMRLPYVWIQQIN